MAGATLKELRKDVLLNLNDLADTSAVSGQRYQTVALNSFINSAARHYVNALDSMYQGYLSSDLSVDVLASVSKYALGSTFRTPIYHVRRTILNFDYPLDATIPYNGTLSTIPVPNNEWQPNYWLEGNTLCLTSSPVSNETGALIVKFPFKMVPLVLDTDPLDDQMYDAEDCIKLHATIRALKAKDVSGALKSVMGWEEELQKAEKAFYCQVGNRFVRMDKPLPIEDTVNNYPW